MRRQVPESNEWNEFSASSNKAQEMRKALTRWIKIDLRKDNR